MLRTICLVSVFGLVGVAHAAEPLGKGLAMPESVVVGPGGRVFVTSIGEFGKDGDGAVLVLDKGNAVPFTKDLDDPKGIVAFQQWLYVADKQRVWRIDPKGKAEVFVDAKSFPKPPMFLNDVAVDIETGMLYVSDSGNLEGKGGAIYRIMPNKKVSLVTDATKWPELHTPNGLALDGQLHLLVADFGTGELHRLKLTDGSHEKVADGLGGADGIVWDKFGRLFVSDWKSGKLFVIARPGDKPVVLHDGLESAADICLDASGKAILLPDMKAGTITAVAIRTPGFEFNDEPLPLETEVAFPNLKWTGWKGETEKGKPNPLRPIVLTHAGDGSNRVFVATQHGVIHVFPNDPKATETKVFLDISERVTYSDNQNEEGFLGLAFHPDYKKNGEFFVFYTPRKMKATNIVSRFRVSKDDPSRADPASEEEILRIDRRPFWNHDGGTVCFGPDGFLYIAIGDGGAANDPYDNGQNLNTIFGKILRIDVNKKESGKNYAIPTDNPLVGRKDARPEIWAYGLRNVWRMAFDRKTGVLWAGEVGQNLFEEINLIVKGGNYGWNRRESLHPFGAKGVGVRPDMIDPIWEYHHDVGKSITGGHVYRGTAFPELDGAYLYADYVSARIWALRYDEKSKRVSANQPIRDRGLPVLSFGEDEKGESYLLTVSQTGQGIYGLKRRTSK